MGLSRITYNDYTFTDRSNYSIDEQYIYDDSGNTVVATRFVLQVKTIVTSEPSAPMAFDNDVYNSGSEMHLLRQRLSKPGCILKIEHDGFYSGPVEINGYSNTQDVSWGPLPRVLSWNPIGHTISAEVVWECEFQVAIAHGRGDETRARGLKSMNIATSFQIDDRGYTTIRHNGYMEVALTRRQGGNEIRDTIDNYRKLLTIIRPDGFKRQVSWDIAPDFKRASFTVIDTEISSPFAWPADVIDIQATHRAGWARGGGMARVMNTISASIELAPGIPKGRAWQIFSSIVARRKAASDKPVFIQSIEVNEEIFQNRISFQCGYYLLTDAPMVDLFRITGIFQDPNGYDGTNTNYWQYWTETTARLHPFQNGPSDRGYANIPQQHNAWKLVDLSTNIPGYAGAVVRKLPPAQMLPPQPLCNQLPLPENSWVAFDAHWEYQDNSRHFNDVTLAPNDVNHGAFDSRARASDIPGVNGSTRRFAEDQAAPFNLIWKGYAERIGYEIPRPGVWNVNGKRYVPVGRGRFVQKFMGNYFCLPKYAASWVQEYEILEPPTSLKAQDGNRGVK